MIKTPKYQTPGKMADTALKAILAILALVTLAQAQHLGEDKRTLINAGLATKNQESVDASTTTTAITTGEDKNATDKGSGKHKDYEDHAEIQMATEKPEESTTLPTEKPEVTMPPTTPSPEPVKKEVENEESDQTKKDSSTTTAVPAVPFPTPAPVLQNPDIKIEDLETEEMKSGTSTTKKPTVVRKDGVEYTGPSVYARKGVNAKANKLPSESSNDSSFPGFSGAETVADTASGTMNKSMATNMNALTAGKKKDFESPLSEASMDFTATKPSVAMQSLSTPTPKSRVPSPRPVGSEPMKPPTTNPPVTKGYSKGHPKPTAATDPLNSKVASGDDEDDISYTPVVVGIVLLVAIIVTVIVVGYRRLQDVWMRRHYARMDFLIDGMYDV